MENITQWHLTFVGIENLGLRVLVLFLLLPHYTSRGLALGYISSYKAIMFLPLDLLRLCL